MTTPTGIIGRAVALVILTVVVNLLFFGGLIWIALTLLQRFGVIAG